jgi:5-formyltetrahydrofolate cyclo-ligase
LKPPSRLSRRRYLSLGHGPEDPPERTLRLTQAPSAKDDLRRRMRARRRDLAALIPDAAERAAAWLSLDALPPFTIVAGYHALGSELSPWPALRKLAARGARIALPVAPQPHAPLVFRAFAPDQPLELDAAKVPSPTEAAQSLRPDLVIAPLIAFDAHGYRLGQGGGYYDRTLAALRASGRLFVIGLAYAGQEAEQIPRDAHDQPLDAILTETGYHPVRKDN